MIGRKMIGGSDRTLLLYPTTFRLHILFETSLFKVALLGKSELCSEDIECSSEKMLKLFLDVNELHAD